MENNKRKQLQDILTDKNWETVEEFIGEYISEKMNLELSAKRQDGFHTIWDRAFTEGGKFHLLDFFNAIENEAKKYDI